MARSHKLSTPCNTKERSTQRISVLHAMQLLRWGHLHRASPASRAHAEADPNKRKFLTQSGLCRRCSLGQKLAGITGRATLGWHPCARAHATSPPTTCHNCTPMKKMNNLKARLLAPRPRGITPAPPRPAAAHTAPPRAPGSARRAARRTRPGPTRCRPGRRA